jgi:hypothetical protein
LNLFAYANNDPINGIDVLGLATEQQYQFMIGYFLDKKNRTAIGTAGELVFEQLLEKAGHIVIKGPANMSGSHNADLISYDPKTKQLYFFDNKIQSTKQTVSSAANLSENTRRLRSIDVAAENLEVLKAISGKDRRNIRKALSAVRKDTSKAYWAVSGAAPHVVPNIASRISTRLAERGVRFADVIDNRLIVKSIEDSIDGARGSKKFLGEMAGKVGKAAPLIGTTVAVGLNVPRVQAEMIEDDLYVQSMREMGVIGPIPFADHSTQRTLSVIAGEEAGGELGAWGGAALGAPFGGWGAIPGALIFGFAGDSAGGWAAGRAFDKANKMDGSELRELIYELH